MAFENIGIGGILSFDSKGAVANMTLAQRAFGGLQQAAMNLKGAVSNIGQGFSKLNFLGGAIPLVAGLGLGAAVREGMKFNKEMETAKIAIATILATVTKTPLADNFIVAEEAISRLNVVAAEAPGELRDMVNIFQLMSGPIVAAGGKMDDILTATKGTAILAGVLKRTFQDTGSAMAKLQAGTIESGNDIIIMLKSMGLIKESTEEWRELLPEQRLKRVQEILHTFAGSGEAVGKTMEAVSSTTASIGRQMAGAFTAKMFSVSLLNLNKINDWFMKDQKAALGLAEAIGEKVAKAIQFMADSAIEAGKILRDIFTFLTAKVEQARLALNMLGFSISQEVVSKALTGLATFMALTAAVSPLITVIGFLGSKVMAVFQIAQGVLGIFTSFLPLLSGPLVVAVGAVLAVIYIMRDQVDVLRGIWSSLVDTVGRFWQGIQPGVENLKAAAIGVVTLLMNTADALAPIISRIISGLVAMVEAIRPGLEAVFNTLARVIKVIVDALNFLLPKLMAVVGPVVNVIMMIAEKVAMVLGKLLRLVMAILSPIITVFEEAVIPVLGYLIDVFGPIFTAAFEVVGVIINALLSALGGVFDILRGIAEFIGGAFSVAWSGVKVLFEAIGWVITNLIVAPIKWVVEKLEWVVDKVSGAIDAVSGFVSDAADAIGGFFSGPSMFELIEQQANQAKKAAEAATAALIQTKYASMTTEQIMADAQRVIQETNAMLMGLQAMSKVQEIVSEATVNAKVTPDVNVNVPVDIKSQLCIDGRNMATASARHQIEVEERAGFNQQPWQNRRVAVTGVKVK